MTTPIPRSRARAAFWLGAAVLCSSCGDDSDDNDGADCDSVISADVEDATDALLTALIEADAGDMICIEPGTYSIERELSLSVRAVTLHGMGDDREAVVLDFRDQRLGDDGITVTADDFTIENMTVKNTPGNGVVVTGAARPVFRNLLVTWDAGSVTDNGAYAVYPVRSTDVLIEDCEIVGAADAGLYVGQSRGAVVRNNDVHGNVAGIEIENTDDADVYDNHAYDNAAGILVFVLQNLEKKDGEHNLVRDNLVEDNNRENFAEPGTVVAAVPPGTGMLLLAADDTEIRNNVIRHHDSVGILAISQPTLDLLVENNKPDPETDPFLSKTHIHDNEYEDNGADPDATFTELGFTMVEDIIYDGERSDDADEDDFCVREDGDVTLRSFDGVVNLLKTSAHITDPEVFACELPPVEF